MDFSTGFLQWSERDTELIFLHIIQYYIFRMKTAILNRAMNNQTLILTGLYKYVHDVVLELGLEQIAVAIVRLVSWPVILRWENQLQNEQIDLHKFWHIRLENNVSLKVDGADRTVAAAICGQPYLEQIMIA